MKIGTFGSRPRPKTRIDSRPYPANSDVFVWRNQRQNGGDQRHHPDTLRADARAASPADQVEEQNEMIQTNNEPI